jgi:hypothetical protein
MALSTASRAFYTALREIEKSFANKVIAPWAWQEMVFRRSFSLSDESSFVRLSIGILLLSELFCRAIQITKLDPSGFICQCVTRV